MPRADSPHTASRPQGPHAGADESGAQAADGEPQAAELPVAQCETPRFAPNDRYGWPEDFLLPLVIEIEPIEVPAAIRGPSPPIEDGQQ